jgi:hypothetical protein
VQVRSPFVSSSPPRRVTLADTEMLALGDQYTLPRPPCSTMSLRCHGNGAEVTYRRFGQDAWSWFAHLEEFGDTRRPPTMSLVFKVTRGLRAMMSPGWTTSPSLPEMAPTATCTMPACRCRAWSADTVLVANGIRAKLDDRNSMTVRVTCPSLVDALRTGGPSVMSVNWTTLRHP